MIQAPKGTFDILPEDAERRKVVAGHAHRILGRAGYHRIETPIFEPTELFARGVGEATDIVQKEMYSFDDGGGRSLTLRPEGTAPVARAYIEHGMHKLPQPVKLWYLGPFFRAEQPQKGRYRQFWQVGAEVIGAEAPEADAEVILLLAELLEAMGVRSRLRLASLGQPETRESYRRELQDFLRAHADELSEEVRGRIELNPMRAFDSGDPGTQRVMQEAPRLLERLTAEDAEHFAAVRAMLEDAAVDYEIDTTLVRGLDYYTRTLFEFTSDALGAQSGVGGGGRYDRLMEQLGGAGTPGVGWAAGVERILLAASEVPIAPDQVDLYVAVAPGSSHYARSAFALAAGARRAGLSAQMELTGRSLKGQMKQAARTGARFVAVVNEEGVILREREDGSERQVAADEVIATVLRGHRL